MTSSIEWVLSIQNITINFIKKILEEDEMIRQNYPDMEIDSRIEQILESIENNDNELFENIEIKFNKKKTKSLKAKENFETCNEASETEKKPKKKKEVDDAHRCMCRTFAPENEEHMYPDGRAKVMRDDPKNMYGDRCKIKKYLNYDFCHRHTTNQPYGVWNGEYKYRLLAAINKANNLDNGETSQISEKSKKTSKVSSKKKEKELFSDDNTTSTEIKNSKKSKKSVSSDLETNIDKFGDFTLDSLDSLNTFPKKNIQTKAEIKPKKSKLNIDDLPIDILEEEFNECLISDASDDDSVQTKKNNGKSKSVSKSDSISKSDNKKQQQVIEECLFTSDDEQEEEIETEPFIYEGIEYNIDSSNNLYLDDGTFVGVFNHSKNIIVKSK